MNTPADRDPAASHTAPDGGDLGSWSEENANRFELARPLINAVIAAYSTRIAADPAAAAELRTAQARYAAVLRDLDPSDEAELARIVREYPALAGSAICVPTPVGAVTAPGRAPPNSRPEHAVSAANCARMRD